MIINTKNFMAWLVVPMVSLMGLALGLSLFVDLNYIWLLFGAIGWIGYMLFYKTNNIYQHEMAEWIKKNDKEVYEYMKKERESRENDSKS